jgi:hypothetical protein
MSVLCPKIVQWDQEGKTWGYVEGVQTRPFNIRPGEFKQVPYDKYYFETREGVLLSYRAAFDHPKCGIRIELENGMDTDDNWTIENMTKGINEFDPIVYTRIPPDTPPGYFYIRTVAQANFKDRMGLHVFNSDTRNHRCHGVAYYIAALKREGGWKPFERE